jgi:hypothetical protein
VVGRVIAKGLTPAPHMYRAFTIIVEDDGGDVMPGRGNRVGLVVFLPFEVSLM